MTVLQECNKHVESIWNLGLGHDCNCEHDPGPGPDSGPAANPVGRTKIRSQPFRRFTARTGLTFPVVGAPPDAAAEGHGGQAGHLPETPAAPTEEDVGRAARK